MLLVAGGALDPHTQRIARLARQRGVPHRTVLIGPEQTPRLSYTVPEGQLCIDGELLRPTALWLRHDVFAALADPRPAVSRRALAWTEALRGWALLHSGLRWPNRRASLRRVNKVEQLARAAEVGLRIPRTRVSNDLPSLVDDAASLVAKPVAGGSLCMAMPELLGGLHEDGGAAPQPAFVQECLQGPEVRAYVVGERLYCWQILTDLLDHRADPDCGVRRTELPAKEAELLLRLAGRLGLTLAAADFKRDPATGDLVFLEINSQPMWTAYDHECGGALSEAMMDWLLAPSAGGPSADPEAKYN